MWKLLLFANLIISLCLAGCDFKISLSDGPHMTIDKQALGLWEREDPDKMSGRLLILPLDEREYFIVWPKGKNTELFARAHFFTLSGEKLVQVVWFGNSDGGTPDDGRKYQVARYSLQDDRLSIRLLNPEVTGKDFQSAAKLAEAIHKNRDDPELFREAMVFMRSE